MTERAEFSPSVEAKGCSPLGIATTIVTSAYRFFFDPNRSQQMYEWVQRHEPQIETNPSTSAIEK